MSERSRSGLPDKIPHALRHKESCLAQKPATARVVLANKIPHTLRCQESARENVFTWHIEVSRLNTLVF